MKMKHLGIFHYIYDFITEKRDDYRCVAHPFFVPVNCMKTTI